MPDRDQFLKLIDEAYEARINGDHEGVAARWAPNASFRIAGQAALIGKVASDEDDAPTKIAELIGRFEFHSLDRVHAVIEGDTAAIHWKLRVSTPGGEPVDTELYDLWKIGEDGKVASLLQFADTALMVQLLEQAELA